MALFSCLTRRLGMKTRGNSYDLPRFQRDRRLYLALDEMSKFRWKKMEKRQSLLPSRLLLRAAKPGSFVTPTDLKNKPPGACHALLWML
jgi:hypothetical protein